MSAAAIIGNGLSRRGYNLLRFKSAAIPVWGCNALYRDYWPHQTFPDYLVMVDDGIIKEVNRSDFPKDHIVVPPHDERWEPAAANPYRPRMNAGMAAMMQAAKRGATLLYCLGFDFLILDDSQALSNLYDGSPNYGPETRATMQDNPGRMRFLSWLMRSTPHVEYTFVYPAGTTVRTLFETNIRWLSYDQLDARLHALP